MPRPLRPASDDATPAPTTTGTDDLDARIDAAYIAARSGRPDAVRRLLCELAGADPADRRDVIADLGPDHPLALAFARGRGRSLRALLRRAT